jgi:hypothetical protein
MQNFRGQTLTIARLPEMKRPIEKHAMTNCSVVSALRFAVDSRVAEAAELAASEIPAKLNPRCSDARCD